jgi:hypothetical protein
MLGRNLSAHDGAWARDRIASLPVAIASDAYAGLSRLARTLEYDVFIAVVDADVKLVCIVNQSTALQLPTCLQTCNHNVPSILDNKLHLIISTRFKKYINTPMKSPVVSVNVNITMM